MKINIASYGGRNHVLDLARELDKQGHDVCLYSYLPTKRAQKFGLKKVCNKSYFLVSLPFLALLKFTKRSHFSLFIFHYFFDYFVGLIARPCDIFIGQSPMHVYALKRARKKYGAKIILERGTRHVLEQIKALSTNPIHKGKSPMPKAFIKRDLLGYQIADYISIPSQVVQQSFIINNIPNSKLIINPYGVNLSEFGPTVLNTDNPYDLIIVGQWSHRKGADLLIQVCEKYKFSLLHVGSIIDVDFPEKENMKHIDPVEQKKLVDYYSQAKIFVLPSREEGLALVQPQALICGLPIVCSKYTGGRDLRKFIVDDKWIIEMEDLSIDELGKCIQKALSLASTQIGKRTYSEGVQNFLSWEAYGRRYSEFLSTLK